MFVHDQSDYRFGRIVCIQILQQGNELATAMPPLHTRGDVSGVQVQCCQNRARAQASVLVVAPETGVLPGDGRQVRRGIRNRLQAGFFVHRDGHQRDLSALLILHRNLLINQQDLTHLGFEFWILTFQIVLHLFGMQWLLGENSVHRGFGGADQ